MPGDLLPLILGTAYACLGSSGLRLARLDGPLPGWNRLCIAGLATAVLEWHSLYAVAWQSYQANDLAGSLLGLISLGAWLEFSRDALARRFKLGPLAQTLAGLLVVALAGAALAAQSGGIYSRVFFAQRSVGLLAGSLTLLVIMAYHLPGARWARAAGLVLLLSLAAALLTRSTWPLVPGVAGAAICLRLVYVVRHAETRRGFARWAVGEFLALPLLLLVAADRAEHRGAETLRLEGRHLVHVTEAAAAALDPDDIRALRGSAADLGTTTYQAVTHRLKNIQQIVRSAADAELSSRFAYLLTMREGRVIFLADQPDDPLGPVRPGDPYDEASPELRRAFVDGPSFLEGPLPDRFGVWVSAFAPVRDQAGQIVALLGIDFDANDWAQWAARARLHSILGWTLVMIIALSLFTSVGLSLESRHQLERSEHLFRTAADYTSTWEYWVGTDGRMIFTSQAAEKLTGYPSERFRVFPRRLLKIIHPSDRKRVVDHLRACAHDSPPCQFDFKIIRRNGETAWVSHSCDSVYDNGGAWSGRRASNRDITTLRQTELSLGRLERLQTGCHQALRRLLGPQGAGYLQDALDLAGQAGDCHYAALMRIEPDRALAPLVTWPAGTNIDFNPVWKECQDRALRLLSVGENFEVLPRETAELAGALRGSHIAIFPLWERASLTGLAIFAAPHSRQPWSRAEVVALATLASGLSAAGARGQSSG
ncbi:MAG: PAS domain-containing protein [Chthoniobacterales bacterium]